MMEVLIFGVVFGIICAVVATSKERNGLGWFLIGFFLGLIGLIAVFVVSDHKKQRLKEEKAARDRRRLQERLKQEQIKNNSLHQTVDARLEIHDKALNIDTRHPAELAESETMQLEAGISAGETGEGWFFALDGEQQGPVATSVIKQLKSSGTLSESSLIFKTGMQEWQPLHSIQELA